MVRPSRNTGRAQLTRHLRRREGPGALDRHPHGRHGLRRPDRARPGQAGAAGGVRVGLHAERSADFGAAPAALARPGPRHQRWLGMIMNWVAPPSNYPRGVKGSISPRYGGGTVYHYVAAMGYDDTRARGRCGSPTPASGPSGTGAASIRSRRSSRRRATRTPTPHPERPGQHHLHVDDRSRVSVNTAVAE